VSGTDDEHDLLADQVAYYRARVQEYDRTAYGDDLSFAQARIANILDRLDPRGNILELACGTGMWTEGLAARAEHLLAVDTSPEALAIARTRVPAEVRLQVADVLRDDPLWSPTERYDVVVMAFWLSHVPRWQAISFLDRVGGWLAPGGRLLVVDQPVGAEANERYDEERADVAVRATTDGTTHRLVKVYLDPEALSAALSARGWKVAWQVDDGWLTGQMAKDPS
jgi:demethylmenaquinone methyltransferase/2-methoxy-6-polyprenyl-1,4-benzoquinol methylase